MKDITPERYYQLFPKAFTSMYQLDDGRYAVRGKEVAWRNGSVYQHEVLVVIDPELIIEALAAVNPKLICKALAAALQEPSAEEPRAILPTPARVP